MREDNPLKELITTSQSRKRVSIIKTIIVKESSMLYGARHINTPSLAAGLARDMYKGTDRELLIVVALNAKCSPLSLELVAVGNINSCVVSPREIFKSSILSNAVHIIMFHNHVSGECTPSSEDILVTKRLIEAGELLGIPLLDHIIIGEGDSYLSLREDGIVPFSTKTQNYTKE